MKKVRSILSSACEKVTAKRCAALFSAAAIAFTSLTATVHYSVESKATDESLMGDFGSQKILELSESFLSLNTENNISVVELSAIQTPESESIVFVEEFSSEHEIGSDETVEEQKEVETQAETTEKSEQKVETTSKKKTEKKQVAKTSDETLKAAAATVSKEDGEYTFEELGLKQVSDIDAPDDILFDENGVPLNYSKKLVGRATAYCMGHTTATGTSVHEGVVAVNPNIIPYGSTLYIVASDGTVYGYSSAEDTGGFIYWDNAPLVDLYVNSTDIAYQWGNREVTIYIF